MDDFYRGEAGRHSLLSAEEEQELAARIANGDRAALNKLVTHNLKLVMYAAGKYSNVVKHSPNISLEDLIQEGNMGLIRAAEKFDGQRGVRFSTFAIHHIRHMITKALREHRTDVHLPYPLRLRLTQRKQAAEHLTQKYGREPSADEIAAYMGVPKETVVKLEKYLTAFNFADSRAGEDAEFDLIESAPDGQMPNPEEEAERRVLRENLMTAAKGRLRAAERQIVFDRIGYNDENSAKTLDEIGGEMGITRERVRQKETKALKKLRTLDFDKLGFNVSVAEKTE